MCIHGHRPPLLTKDDTCTLCLLEVYGRLIGNTNRHYGNLSLALEGGDWSLSPAYDTRCCRVKCHHICTSICCTKGCITLRSVLMA